MNQFTYKLLLNRRLLHILNFHCFVMVLLSSDSNKALRFNIICDFSISLAENAFKSQMNRIFHF